MTFTLHHGDAMKVLPTIADGSVHAVVTDPPYNLEFMSSKWDRQGSAKRYQWWCWQWAKQCHRVLPPGGHLLAFGGTRTVHRLASGIEDAGFEIRDAIAWLHGEGFPKSLDVAKAITATQRYGGANGTRRRASDLEASGEDYTPTGRIGQRDGFYRPTGQARTVEHIEAAKPWVGWGTQLRPAFEQIVVARKPLRGHVAGNVVEFGTGALNVGATRVEGERWPPNVALGEEVADGLDQARFFFCPKAKADEKPKVDGVTHLTVKPLTLVRWLVRLVTPPGGTVLDPFLGSGTTALACRAEGFDCIGIEADEAHLPVIEARMA